MAQLMQGFPPAAEGQVTLANWRNPPFARWAFQHVREVVPSADIPNDPGNVWTLPPAAADLSGVRINGGAKGQVTLEAFLQHTNTDGLVVLHRGRLVHERYLNGMTPGTPHILMSVTKSMLGLVAGILSAKGILDPERLVTDVIPELANTAYRGATIRHLLDMRVGLAFDEDYTATSGAIVEYRKSTNWNPLGPGEAPSDLRSFYANLRQSTGPHGRAFHYVSPNSDLLGWVVERASGRRFADLMSELIWQPLGASRSAYITVDRLGAPRCAGGMCMTVSDLARVGQMIVDGGTRDGRQIVPESWIDDIATNGDPAAWAAGPFAEYFPDFPMHYRSKWYVERSPAPALFGFGIHGQYLYVDPKNEVVIAKLSSESAPIDPDNIRLSVRAFSAIRDLLAKG